MIRKAVTRVKGDRFCTLRVELSDDERLSICGTAGEVVTRRVAKTMALESWASLFDDSNELAALNERCGTHFRSSTSAARYVLSVDGEFHGLSVESDDGKTLQVGHSWGQIREEIAEFFPEVVPYFRWHLNGAHPECEHQEARGEAYNTHPSAVCPDCGYRLGSGWTRRKLPAEVVAWVKGLA